MKTAEELDLLKTEIRSLNAKLAELSDDELAQVNGGMELEKYLKSLTEKDRQKGLFDKPIPSD